MHLTAWMHKRSDKVTRPCALLFHCQLLMHFVIMKGQTSNDSGIQKSPCPKEVIDPSLFHARNEGIIGGEKDEEEGGLERKRGCIQGSEGRGNFQPPPLLGRKSAENAKEKENEEADVQFISLGMGRNGNLGPHVLPNHAHPHPRGAPRCPPTYHGMDSSKN